jgi:ketosteroid isomerase-like protein
MIHPAKFAQQWIEAWNGHDLEMVLSFYAEDIQVRSPFAKLYKSDGIIKGKDALRSYWGEALRRMPNIKFKLIATYSGHMALAIHYEDETGRNVIETMLFNDRDKVVVETACLDRPR